MAHVAKNISTLHFNILKKALSINNIFADWFSQVKCFCDFAVGTIGWDTLDTSLNAGVLPCLIFWYYEILAANFIQNI